MERLAHEIVVAYKDAYYAQRRVEVDKVVVEYREVEVKAREELATDLANQQAVQQATLLWDKQRAEKGLEVAKAACTQREAQAMEATLLVKEAVEVNMRMQKDLRIRTKQVYELHRLLDTLGMQPPLKSLF